MFSVLETMYLGVLFRNSAIGPELPWLGHNFRGGLPLLAEAAVNVDSEPTSIMPTNATRVFPRV